jgi:hypothetical protein
MANAAAALSASGITVPASRLQEFEPTQLGALRPSIPRSELSRAGGRACRVRKFGRVSQKRLFAGKTEFGSSLHQIVARAVLV